MTHLPEDISDSIKLWEKSENAFIGSPVNKIQKIGVEPVKFVLQEKVPQGKEDLLFRSITWELLLRKSKWTFLGHCLRPLLEKDSF